MTEPKSQKEGNGFLLKENFFLNITEGEVDFLWAFLHGGILNETNWDQLMGAWGFCSRHACVYLNVELAFRKRYLISSSILYKALLSQALSSWSKKSKRAIGRQLRDFKPCLVCEMKLPSKIRSTSKRRQARLEIGQDTTELQRFLTDCKPAWGKHVCSICAGGKGHVRCRQHLIADIKSNESVDLKAHRLMLEDIERHLDGFLSSFSQERRGTATIEEAGALISAVGWCRGWESVLRFEASHE